MPRYDYRCTSCGNTFEVTHGMREHPEVVCPDCAGPAQRIFDVSGIVLKGSGFYNTDQRGKKGTTPATGGKDPEAGSSAEKSGAAESKAGEGSGPKSDGGSSSGSSEGSASASKDSK